MRSLLCACFLGVTLMPALAACGQSSHAQSTVVLFDNQGRCPLTGRAVVAYACRSSREGRANAVTSNFQFPLKSWGIAYAFHCKKSDDFYVAVGIPGGDAYMPDTAIYRRGISGRGYYMETGKGVATYQTTPKVWRDPENLEIESGCAWHVRGVVGNASAVPRYVPPIPKAG